MSQPAKKYDFVLNQPGPRSGAGRDETDFPDDWYLMPYRLPSPQAASRSRGRILLAAVGVCVCAGLLTCWLGFQSQSQTARQGMQTVEEATSAPAAESTGSAAVSRENSAVPAVQQSTTGAKAASAAASEEEVARLKTRNRRLEALIKVLRQRPPEKKVPADSAAYGGQ